MIDTAPYRIDGSRRFELATFATDDGGELDKDEARAQFRRLTARLSRLQELLYAQGRHALLVIFQAMDTGGKDSTIRAVFGPLDPQGFTIANFKAPTPKELRHDFLWRIHQHVPERGYITVFNRSHYEDVLIVRVKGLVPEARWKRRYRHINAFETMLHDEGAIILKFFLHISPDYQKKRLQRRLLREDKIWKFDPADLVEREHWDQYQEAYEQVLGRCASRAAPWYVVPAERRWFRNLLVAQVISDTLESLAMKYPQPTFDPAQVRIR